jgi:hypothetical protein
MTELSARFPFDDEGPMPFTRTLHISCPPQTAFQQEQEGDQHQQKQNKI